jgi:hypothetical protein
MALYVVSIGFNSSRGGGYFIDENDSWNNFRHTLVNIALNDLVDFSS